jgi:hypothetical protein
VSVTKQFWVPQRGRIILDSPAIVGFSGRAVDPETNPLFSYLLTPWSRVLLEKLSDS